MNQISRMLIASGFPALTTVEPPPRPGALAFLSPPNELEDSSDAGLRRAIVLAHVQLERSREHVAHRDLPDTRRGEVLSDWIKPSVILVKLLVCQFPQPFRLLVKPPWLTRFRGTHGLRPELISHLGQQVTRHPALHRNDVEPPRARIVREKLPSVRRTADADRSRSALGSAPVWRAVQVVGTGEPGFEPGLAAAGDHVLELGQLVD